MKMWPTFNKKIKAQVVLDESKYGRGLFRTWRWAFESVYYRKAAILNEEDGGSLITVTDNKKPILIAVTKKQFKSWNKQEIFAIRRPLLNYCKSKISRYIRKNIKPIISRHIIKSTAGYYGYLYFSNFTLIISKYGLKIIASRRNQSIWSIIYEYYQGGIERLIDNYRA